LTKVALRIIMEKVNYMEFERKAISAPGIKLFRKSEGEIIARVFLYFLGNDLHKKPLCAIEDLFIVEGHRRQGIGKELFQEIVKIAKANGCYKLIATSRYKRSRVHKFYKEMGMEDYGKEFRMNL